jgi:hypothetical protein
MLIIKNKRFGWWTCLHGVGVGMSLSLLSGIVSVAFAVNAQAAVIEFFNPDLNNYFITAEPAEQDFVDTGGVGRWLRTGNAFATGGPNQVCRFYGNSFGPNSHFYTAEPAECAYLKSIYTPNAKSWNFESNDFLTTPAVNGTCPAALVPVYRAYNNGFARGIDSNHRITSNHAAYLETVAAGSIGEGVVMCAPAGPPPIATAVGVAIGSAASATIGAAGGKVTAPDGKLVLTIPAGALAADTVISIQPFTNTAPGKSGAAYRLTPEGQTFLKPITLTFTYTDQDLLGTAAAFLGAAFQTADGYWHWIGDPTVDTAAKTMSVALSHFTVIAEVSKYQITPASKTVKVNGSVGLTVRFCYESGPLADLQGGGDVLGTDCNFSATLTQSKPTLSVNEWSVNTRLRGGPIFGTVSGSGATATYTAPSTIPIPNPVAVSARVHDPKNPNGKDLVSSTITIADASWTGTTTTVMQFRTLTVDVTWVQQSFVNNVAVFSPTGTASISLIVVPGCTARFDPAFHSLDTSDGALTIDYNTTPPSYHGYGVTVWSATLSAVSGDCEGTTPPAAAGGPFFGGRNNGFEAAGSVSPDGVTIQGSDTDVDGNALNWKFTRDQ